MCDRRHTCGETRRPQPRNSTWVAGAFEKEDGEAKLVIEDNGVETSRAVVGNGAGGSFGLTLISGLAMQLGGEATISEREGGGTRVVVTFPLPRDEAGHA